MRKDYVLFADLAQELFNLKDWANDHMAHIPAISRLQETINGHNPIKFKRLILEIVQRVEDRKDPADGLMENAERFRRKAHLEARDLEKIITIHALDLLYFWRCQPRARSALDQLLRNINEEERHLLVTSQLTLLRQRDISQMFIDGVLGHDFARGLAFYLSRYPEYLEAMKKYV